MGRRRDRASRRREHRGRRRARRVPSSSSTELRRGRSSRLDRVGPRGRVARRGRARRGSHRRRGRARGRRRLRLVAWKPAFGGQLVAAIGIRSPAADGDRPRRRAPARSSPAPRRADVRVRTRPMPRARPRPRARAHPRRRPRPARRSARRDRRRPRRRARRLPRARTARSAARCRARRDPQGHRRGLARRAHARSGSPAASIAPRLFVSIGASGKFNHIVGVRAAGTVLAINSDATRRSSTRPTSASSATGKTRAVARRRAALEVARAGSLR